MMADNNILFLVAYCMLAGFTISYVTAKTDCKAAKCLGPVQFYKDLSCKPIKNNTEDCCAAKYDCNHIQQRDPQRCYLNGKVYNIGDQLEKTAMLPCEEDCMCTLNNDNIAQFTCNYQKCPYVKVKQDCFRTRLPLNCCPSDNICLAPQISRHVCNVTGNLYYEGQIFKDDKDPTLLCTCHYAYNGENVAPFCAKMNRKIGNPEFEWPGGLRNYCTPIYEKNQDYSLDKRCPVQGDRVIRNSLRLGLRQYPDKSLGQMQCKFGNLTFNIGDELFREPDTFYGCTHCICEVPPYLTCRRQCLVITNYD